MTKQRLADLGIDFPVMVGPMVGLSHAAFRALLRSYTPPSIHPLIFTEMLSAKRIPHDSLAKTPELRVVPGERQFVPQLLGNDAEIFRLSFEKLKRLNPWGFDINMGCPVDHVLKHNWGVQLMGDVDYAARVVDGARRHTPLPLSVKLRAGLGKTIVPEEIFHFTSTLVSAGADWLTVHLRTQEQGHKGEADWNLGSRLCAELPVPVVLNGNVQTADDAVSLVRDRQVDGVMICRAAVARPWIFWQIAEDLGYTEPPTRYPNRRAPRTPDEEGREFLFSMLKLLDLLEEHFTDDTYRCERICFHAAHAIPWLDFGHAFWKLTTGAKTGGDMRARIEDFAARFELRMSPQAKHL